MSQSRLTRLAAGVAALGLTVGLAACSSDNKDTTPGNSSTSSSASSSASSSSGSSSSTKPEDKNRTVDVKTADGKTALVPSAFAEALKKSPSDFGKLQAVHQGENGWVATYEKSSYIAWSDRTGAQPIIGMIAEQWVNDGAADNPLGMPKAPEKRLAAPADGWSQEFEHGTLTWINENGQFVPKIDQK